MTEQEKEKRIFLEANVSKYSEEFCKKWKDHEGNTFDNKYKVLSTSFSKDGMTGINKLIKQSADKYFKKKHPRVKLFRRKRK